MAQHHQKSTCRATAPAKQKKRCKNCDKPFPPGREWQEFCGANCRKEFWRHGGVSIRRMLPTIKEQLIAPLEARIAALEAALKERSGQTTK